MKRQKVIELTDWPKGICYRIDLNLIELTDWPKGEMPFADRIQRAWVWNIDTCGSKSKTHPNSKVENCRKISNKWHRLTTDVQAYSSLCKDVYIPIYIYIYIHLWLDWQFGQIGLSKEIGRAVLKTCHNWWIKIFIMEEPVPAITCSIFEVNWKLC